MENNNQKMKLIQLLKEIKINAPDLKSLAKNEAIMILDKNEASNNPFDNIRYNIANNDYGSVYSELKGEDNKNLHKYLSEINNDIRIEYQINGQNYTVAFYIPSHKPNVIYFEVFYNYNS